MYGEIAYIIAFAYLILQDQGWEVIDEPTKVEVGEDTEAISSSTTTQFYLPLSEDGKPAEYLCKEHEKLFSYVLYIIQCLK